jgi:PAS domain-containing protein
VLTFPSGDLAFREHVTLAQERLLRWNPVAIIEQVRLAYPAASTIQASETAVLDADVELWYVYRDGRVLARSAEGEWSDQLGTGHAVIGQDGRYVDADEAAAALFGVPRGDIIGRLAGEFSRHENDEALGRRLLTLADRQELSSTAVVLGPDADERWIEFLIRSSPAGYYVSMRRISEKLDKPMTHPDRPSK